MKENDPAEWCPTRSEIEALIWERTAGSFAPRVETLCVDDALGRVCAHDVHALRDLPNALCCRWDGVAVRYDDVANAPLNTPTQLFEGPGWKFGNTGIAMPEGFDTLIRIEDVELTAERALVVKRLPAHRGEYTMPAGCTMAQGELLVSAHQVLGPCHLGVLAMGGHTHVDVLARPVVAIIPSGNELVGRTVALPRGKNVETNSLVLANKVRSWGGRPLVYGIVPDDFDLLLAALKDATEKADIVFFNAGSSKGTDDHAEQVLRTAGELLFHRTSYGPGNHTGFCMVGTTPVLALVGVPGGAEFNADWYGEELVRRYYGIEPRRYRHALVELENGFKLRNHAPCRCTCRRRSASGREGLRRASWARATRMPRGSPTPTRSSA